MISGSASTPNDHIFQILQIPHNRLHHVFRLDTLLLPELRQADRRHHILLRVLQISRVRTVIRTQHRSQLSILQRTQLPVGLIEGVTIVQKVPPAAGLQLQQQHVVVSTPRLGSTAATSPFPVKLARQPVFDEEQHLR